MVSMVVLRINYDVQCTGILEVPVHSLSLGTLVM